MKYFVHSKFSHARILAQQGAFVLFGLHDETDLYAKTGNYIMQHEFFINSKNKKKIREILKMIGISQNTLFPEIEHAASMIRTRYQ